MSRLSPAQARLLRTVEPHAGEDIRSVAVRYATTKRLDVDFFLSAGLDMSKGHLASLLVKKSHAKVFGELAGFDIMDVAYDIFGHNAGCFDLFSNLSELGVITPAHRRIAPSVLKSDSEPYIRALWQIDCLPCDFETGDIIHSFCFSCGSALSWLRIRALYLCQNCGFDMRDCPSSCASEEVRELVGLMCGLLRRDPTVLRRIPIDIGTAPVYEQFAFLSWLTQLLPIEHVSEKADPQTKLLNALNIVISNNRHIGDIIVSLLLLHKANHDRFSLSTAIGLFGNEANYLPEGQIKTAVKFAIRNIVLEIHS